MSFAVLSAFFSILMSPLGSILGVEKAYLDPGSGSYLLQLLIAGLLGSLFVIRASWSRIIGFFNRDAKEDDSLPVEETETDEE